MAGLFGASFQRWWGVATTLRPPVRSWVAQAGPGGLGAGWAAFDDRPLGGGSECALSLEPGPAAGPAGSGAWGPGGGEGVAWMRGELRAQLRRQRAGGAPPATSGFCGVRADGLALDLQPFDALALRVFGDGKTYIVSLRTDSWIVGDENRDLFQAFMRPPAGVWAEVHLDLDKFLQTWKGHVILEDRQTMNKKNVIGLSITLANAEGTQDAQEGPFSLYVDWIKVRAGGGEQPRKGGRKGLTAWRQAVNGREYDKEIADRADGGT